jgi:hypothetical protein
VTTYTLLKGTADEWPQEYPAVGKDQVVPLDITDATVDFNRQLDITAPAELTGARIQRIVTALGWPGAVDIDTGVSLVPALRLETISAWSHMQDVAATEFGDLYVAKDGTLTFRDRVSIITDTRSSVSQASFSEHGAGGLQYVDVTTVNLPVINHVTITYNSKGSQVTESDAVSIAKPWGLRTLSLSLPMQTGSQASSYARWLLLLYANPVTTFATMTLKPGNDPANLYPQVFGRELSDLITISQTPFSGNPGTPGTTLTRTCWIRGIRHDYSDHVWTGTTFTLQDASWLAHVFIMDTSSLDGSDIVGL